jgi:hypothetical protein
LNELVDDPRLLRGGRGIKRADQLRQLLLRALRPEDKSEDADDEREDRDDREEQLERDSAREERAFVIRERRCDGTRVADQCSDQRQDAASLFGAGLSDAFVSDLPDPLSPFASVLVSLFVSLLVSVLASPFLSALAAPSDELFSAGRLSVLYQPEPLKTIAGIDSRRRGFFPQFGHFSSASSLNDWTAEKTWPQ